MRHLLLFLVFAAGAAQADIYRWIDRETGTVKFSNLPPPWYGDPEKERNAPAVEVIRYRLQPANPVAAAQKPAPTQKPPANDFERAGAAIQQHLDAYHALSAELDRLDPAGAPRRREQEPRILERLRRGLEAQLRPKPPAQ